jgi:hypothetical protein
VEQEQHYGLSYISGIIGVSGYAAHKEEASRITFIREDVLEHCPVVVALACFLLLMILCFDLSKFDLHI